jgi:hypothetical protein
MQNRLSCFFVLMMMIVACKKNETTAPVIQIFAPLANDTFVIADSFRIHFSIKDEHLQSYKIIIANRLNNKIYITEEGNVNSSEFVFDEKRYIKLQADTSVYMNVLGIDANGNTGSNGVTFRLEN